MGTVSTSPTSTAGFNGSSTYAAQLQNAITRAVQFASLPVQQLQNEQTDLNNQQSEISNLTTQFQSLQAVLDNVNQSVGTGSYAATVETPAVATATISSGASAGSFSVDVTSIGSLTNTMSNAGLTTVTDPTSQNIDQSTSYTLTANGSTYQISPATKTLDGLAQAINQSSADVQATVVNVGSSSAPDYRISIQNQAYSPNAIQLNDGTTDLLSNLTTGSYVTYQVNGQPSTPIQATSRSAMISPGVSVNFLATGTTNVTVAQNAASLSDALSSLATAYNAVTDELAKSRGQNGGALSGQSIVSSLQTSLLSLATYTGSSGNVQSMADLGLTFDTSGHLQFDSSVLSQASSNSLSNVLSFVGTETSGGFLQAATNVLQSVTDATNGTLTQASQSITDELSSIGTKITDDNTRITLMQTSLTAQMAQADSTIASLESQVSYYTDLFSTQRANATLGY